MCSCGVCFSCRMSASSYDLDRAREREREIAYRRQMEQMLRWQEIADAAPPRRVPPKPAPVSLEKMFVAGPTIAYRLWRVRRFGSGLRLGSVGTTAWMAAGTPAAATCTGRSGHAAPAPDCTCGWYGVKDAAKLATKYQPNADDVMVVLGHVGLWGRVIEHEHGYRAQYAYPVRVWRRAAKVPLPAGFPRARVFDDTLAEIAATYGCEVGEPLASTEAKPTP